MAEDRRRLQSPTERELASEARRKTAPRGIPAVPVEIDFEVATGVVEGVELEERRARRPTPIRIGHLEKRTDAHGEQIAELTVTVGTLGRDLGEVVGQLKELPKTVDRLAKAVEDLTEERRAEALLQKQKHSQEEQLQNQDQQHARQQWRERWTKIIGGLAAGGILTELVHWLLSKVGAL